LPRLREFKRFRGQISLFRPIAIATVNLAREWFDTLLEAKVLIERWRRHFNTVRPHNSLGVRRPGDLRAADCETNQPTQPAQPDCTFVIS
jgi:transposase InsO family protein